MEIHPVDLLMDLVISEEMDPWDIDIAKIANGFLKRVKEMEKVNLRLSGRTLYAASILLRMKSECLMPLEEEEEGLGDFMDTYSYDEGGEGVDSHGGGAVLSVPAMRRVERKATLFELIEALQRALSEEMIRKNFPREVRRRKLVIQVDEEGMEERMEGLYEMIKKLAGIEGVIKFSELLSEKSSWGVVDVILPLLYLASEERIDLWQEDIFGEIFITLGGHHG